MKIDREAFKRGVDDMFTMRLLRWWLFKRISAFGWWICPEPHRTNLYMGMRFDPNWKDYLPEATAIMSGKENADAG